MSTARVPVETLLAHREWVRAVARAVVRDPNAADDVEQETWLAALRSPPREASSLRGWFGAVTRSRARRIGRTDARRDARESASARREATPSAADLAEMADTHRRVVQAVVELDEPYREAILLRYFEGLAVADVAARSEVPLETARSRVKRGVAKLRERLSEELGDDERPWEMALVPLLAKPHAAGLGAAGGGIAMASTAKSVAAVAVLIVAIGGGAYVATSWTSEAPKESEAATGASSVLPQTPAARTETPAAAPRPRRQRAAENPAPPPPPEPKREETAREKLDRATMAPSWNQAPLVEVLAEIAATADVEIVLSKEADDLIRGNGGAAIESLQLDQPVKARQVLDLVTQLKGLAWTIEEPRIVIVPPGGKRDASLALVAIPKWTPPGPIDVMGRVTDANGAYVAGAEIVQVQRGVRTVATTDNAGHYDARLEWPYGSLEARIAGQVRSFSASVAGKPGEKVTLDFALRGPAGSVAVRVTTEGRALSGVVVTLGTDAPGTKSDERGVAQQPLSATTDAQGSAVFPGVPPGRVAVVARSEGFDDLIRVVQVAAGTHVVAEMSLVPKSPLSQKLDSQHVSFNFQGARLADVLKFLNDAKGLNIVVDPACAATLENIDITLDLRDVSVRQALRTLCKLASGVTFDVHESEGIVWIHADKR
jgi:RNA polymerase sigma-70 factor (ECF subfamily)